MDISVFLNNMRDPAGVPFYPVIFQVLMVLTFALHIVMVNLVVGSIFVALWEAAKKTDYSTRLAKALGRVITVSFSIAIVLGVAPLLFVQVIYDPFWYTANTMSAFYALLFLAVVTVGFYAGYAFYLGNRKNDAATFKTGWGWLALMAVLVAGTLIHMLSMEQLMPAEWKNWVITPEGHYLTGGGQFHGVAPGRLLHILLPSFAVTGVFMMLYAVYFRKRPDYDPEYLDYVAKRGVNLAFVFSVVAAAAGFWWAGEIPGEFHFLQNPFFIAGAIGGIALTAYLGMAHMNPEKYAIRAAIAMFVVIFVMCAAREGLRMDYAGAAGYSIFDYKVNVDWPSTLLFLVSFVMGLYVLCFPAIAAFRAGRAPAGEVVTIEPSHGKRAVTCLIVWFAVVAGLGLIISLKNGTLF